ncbi:MAG: helix-turn-helix domain-containing protein [Ramlibacter sp.]
MTEMTSSSADREFAPDWVSPPGETIVDLLEERGWTQNELADRLGYSSKHVSQLVKGHVSLSEEAAVRLHTVLGGSVGFWLAREAQYREHVALREELEKHAAMVPWLEQFPLKELMSIGALPKCRLDDSGKKGLVAALLAFFGVASPDQWRAHYGRMELAFRRSREDQADIAAISAWLRLGEREAEKVDAPRFDEASFVRVLDEIRGWTVLPPEQFSPRLKDSLLSAGVALVLVPALPRAHVSGVARWLSASRPLIQLSLYGKTNDRFWFSFFHEAAHILLHGGQRKSVFLDDPSKAGSDSNEEREANEWARDWLIRPTDADHLRTLPHTRASVEQFARSIGVHPGIVVGRMQHDRLLDIRWLNDLKVSFELTTI